jgi:hypothetical protein
MRLNVYSQELITADADRPWSNEPTPALKSVPLSVIDLVTQEADTGITYSAVRLFLHSPEQLHARQRDDDRSAITFWLPKSRQRREFLAKTFEDLARMIHDAPDETGLD